jgi:hypothetical protein
MNYSLERISTVTACDALLILAQKDKESLERRKRNMGETIGNFGARTSEIADEVISVQLLLQTYTTVYVSLPEGKEKADMFLEIKRLETRKAQLDKSVISYNSHSLLGKQVDYNLVDSQVTIVDAYIAAVQNRKIALGGTA